MTKDRSDVLQGTLDLLRSEWRVTDNNRRARYYTLTPSGRRYLNESLAQWRRVSRAIRWP